MSQKERTALIVGCGYVGRRLAQALSPTHRVAALVRSDKSRAALRELGVDNAMLDLDAPASLRRLPREYSGCACLFYLAPPPAEGTSDARLDRFLRLIDAPPAAFVYMSTTGVYGDAQGEWVDESSKVAPRTERAQRRVSAEEMTRVWCHEREVRRVVLRVPAIYGPGRLPLERLRRGDPIVRLAESSPGNRIHVDDLVAACVAAANNGDARGAYNVVDDDHSSTSAFMLRVAQLARLPEPPQISLEEARLTFSAEQLSFLEESRRIDNRRLRTELCLQLQYSNNDDGIRASL